MKNLVSIIEIPTTDLRRAISFYQDVLELSIEETEMDGTQMGILASDGGSINVVLAKGNDYKPNSNGAVVYFNTANLSATLQKIEAIGGKVIMPKTEISPEMGFFALFLDTEGNKLGLHSGE
jgi:predicted enzyme related to lactoylglutathione lyase